MKRLIYFFICTLLLPISAKAIDFNKVRNDTIGLFHVDEIKTRRNCLVYRMTDKNAKKYSVVSTGKQRLELNRWYRLKVAMFERVKVIPELTWFVIVWDGVNVDIYQDSKIYPMLLKEILDEENKTITVSAQYYTTESYVGSLSKALNFWNGQSGKFKIEENIINFDLSAVIVTPFSGRSDHNAILNMRSQTQENTYEESLKIKINEYGEPIAGEALDGRFITKYINFADEETVSHEIGHTLGLGHLDGTIMDPNRDTVMPIVTPEQVESIINNSNTNKDAGKRIETEHKWRD